MFPFQLLLARFKDHALAADNVDFSDAAGIDKNRGYLVYSMVRWAFTATRPLAFC